MKISTKTEQILRAVRAWALVTYPTMHQFRTESNQNSRNLNNMWIYRKKSLETAWRPNRKSSYYSLIDLRQIFLQFSFSSYKNIWVQARWIHARTPKSPNAWIIPKRWSSFKMEKQMNSSIYLTPARDIANFINTKT